MWQDLENVKDKRQISGIVEACIKTNEKIECMCQQSILIRISFFSRVDLST